MFCGYCGNKIEDGLSFCPHCGNRLDTPQSDSRPSGGADPVNAFRNQFQQAHQQQNNEQPQPKKKRGKKRGVLVAVIAIVLVAAICAGVFFLLPKNSSGGSDPFSKAAKAAPKGSSNREVLSVLSAAYATLFNTDSFGLDVRADDDLIVHFEAEFGKDLLSSSLYGYTGRGYESAALSNGTFIGQGYGDGVYINGADIEPDLSRVIDHFGDRLGPIYVQNIQQAFVKEALSSKDKVMDIVLHLVKNNRLNIDALNSFVSLVVDAFKSYDPRAEISFTSLDSLFEIAGDFIANMPENTISIQSTKSGQSTDYTYSFNLLDVADAFIRYVENDPSLESFVKMFVGVESLDEAKEDLEYERNNYYSYYNASGSVSVQSNVLTSITITDDGDDTVQFKFTNVNETNVSSSVADTVQRQIDDYELRIYDGNDLIELIDDYFDYY